VSDNSEDGLILCRTKNNNDSLLKIEPSLLNETMENANVWEQEEQMSLT